MDSDNNNELNQNNNNPNINQRRNQTDQPPIRQPRRYNPLNPSNMPQNSDALPPKNGLNKKNGLEKRDNYDNQGLENKKGLDNKPTLENDELINEEDIDINENVNPISYEQNINYAPVQNNRNSINNNNSNFSNDTNKNSFLNRLNRLNRGNNQDKDQEDSNKNDSNDNANNNKKTDNTDSTNNDKKTDGNENNTKSNETQNANNIPSTNNKKKSSTGKKTGGKSTSTPGMSKAQMASKAMNAIKDSESLDEAKEVLKEEVKQEVKKQVKRKILTAIIQALAPFLPYIFLIFMVAIFIFLSINVIFNFFTDEKRIILDMELNYCEQVNLKWIENIDGIEVEKDVTIGANDYVVYEISSSDFNIIDDVDALRALSIVYRTNLYNNTSNMVDNVCYFEIEGEYEETENTQIINAVKDTENKVFSINRDHLNDLMIDEYFSYTKVEDDKYILYQDLMFYNKNWVDSHVFEDKIVQFTPAKRSFSPYGAWHLASVNNYNYHELLYHYLSPTNTNANIYNAVKIGGSMYGDGSFCGDIPLFETNLSRQEFIDAVNNKVNSEVFKKNAGKIYDISIKNDFNPEMVVIRAKLEGNFKEQGGSNNYWGLACYNGTSKCADYSSFDQGVLAFINNIKGHNYTSAYNMMLKYSYIGKYWFNPGGSGLGGCHYFEHVRNNMSEERASEVEQACQSGKSCTKDGVGDCLKTTDEDQQAYAKYQVSLLAAEREAIFGIPAGECPEQGSECDGAPEATGDLSSLGSRVAAYAVAHFNSYEYSQENRMSCHYVDCSSMVARSYAHFSYAFSGSENTDTLYKWCKNNGKLINSSSALKAGDLIFFDTGKTDHINGIGHVVMYIGNNQVFAARSAGSEKNPIAPADQVKVSGYYGGDYFCRPTK